MKVHNNYLGRSMSYEKRDIRSKKFLVIKGDTSDVDFSNDSKSEMISPKMSIN